MKSVLCTLIQKMCTDVDIGAYRIYHYSEGCRRQDAGTLRRPGLKYLRFEGCLGKVSQPRALGTRYIALPHDQRAQTAKRVQVQVQVQPKFGPQYVSNLSAAALGGSAADPAGWCSLWPSPTLTRLCEVLRPLLPFTTALSF